jgi:hypothetical protein
MEDKDAIINQQWLIMRDQEQTINKQRCQLAYYQQFERYKHPISFLLWVTLNDVWPFRFWYHRND